MMLISDRQELTEIEKANINMLADTIEQQPVTQDYKTGFQMGTKFHYLSGCPSCMKGFGYMLMHRMNPDDDVESYMRERDNKLEEQPDILYMEQYSLSNLLGIYDQEQSYDLFIPRFRYANYGRKEGKAGFITPQHAASVLRNFADTGMIDWKIGADNNLIG